jgi:N-acetylneuraminic acid mutarotase
MQLMKTLHVWLWVSVAALTLGLSFCVVGVLPVFAANQGSWVSKSPMIQPTGQLCGCATVWNGEIYTVSSSGIELCKYNPKTDNWTQQTTLPDRFNTCGVAACGDKIYVVGNAATSTGAGYTATDVYDPRTDTWEMKAPMPPFLWDTQPNVVDGKIYVISGGKWHGYGVFEPVKSNYVYDPATDVWSELTSIPVPVAFYASTVFEGKIYIMGGMTHYSYPSTREYTKAVQIFDPQTNSWTQGTSLPNSMSGAAACSTTGVGTPKQIYIVGGTSVNVRDQPETNAMYIYNPQIATWVYGPEMPTARSGLSLVNVNDKLYALGGAVSGIMNWQTANEEYTPADYNYTAPPTLAPTTTPTNSAVATNLPSPLSTGTVMVTPSGSQTPQLTPSNIRGTDGNVQWIVVAAVVVGATGVLVVIAKRITKRKQLN